jgi:hypothetical protein
MFHMKHLSDMPISLYRIADTISDKPGRSVMANISALGADDSGFESQRPD